MRESGAAEYKKLVIDIDFLLSQTESVTGNFLTKSVVVGKKEMKTLMSGYIEIQSGSTTFFFRGFPVKVLSEASHLGIEITLPKQEEE